MFVVLANSARNRVARRIYAIGGLSVASMLLLSVMAGYLAATTQRATHNLYKNVLSGIVQAADVELLLEEHRRIVEVAPRQLSPHDARRDRRALEAIGARLQGAWMAGAIGRSATKDATLAQVLDGGQAVLSDVERQSPAAAIASLHRYLAVADRLRDSVRTLRASRTHEADRRIEAAADQGRHLGGAIISLAGLSILVLAPLGILLMRHVVKRLRDITDAMTKLAHNDTSVALIPVDRGDSGDELGQMARAVEVFKSNAMMLLEQKGRVEQLNLWLDIALNNMARGLSMFDAQQRLVVCNAIYARMYELPDTLIKPGTEFWRIIDHRKRTVEVTGGEVVDPGNFNARERARNIARVSSDTKTSLMMRNGCIFEVSISPLVSGGWVAVHEDVTEQRRAAEQIARLARHDPMTGLANRLQFRERLEQAIADVGAGAQFALLCIDLDRFKEVNDTLGHPMGDALLKAVAKRLEGTVRSGDVIARLGGDEFAIIQTGVTGQSDVAALARRLIEQVSQPYQIQGQRLEVGATVGVALAPTDGDDPDTLLKNADMALYRAKEDGRGRFTFFDIAMEGRLRARRALEIDLHLALERNELELYYQPIISLERRTVAGCEALIRWKHPERGMVSPADFIPLAEDIGLIPAIGELALKQACAAAATWPSPVKVAVNLSPAQFGTSDLVATARDALRESGLAPERLELEVTESLILDDDPATVDTLHSLRKLGIQIALDDFGTGYSSLSYLRRFPFDKIKIDQTFVRDLSQRQDCVAIVGAVAQLARSLAMSTVAEGVETSDHFERVRAAGCTEAQGYLFSRPVPADRIVATIEKCNGDLNALPEVA